MCYTYRADAGRGSKQVQHGSGNEVVRVKEGNVPADDIGDDSDSASESDEDEDGVIWARFGLEAEAYIRRRSI